MNKSRPTPELASVAMAIKLVLSSVWVWVWVSEDPTVMPIMVWVLVWVWVMAWVWILVPVETDVMATLRALQRVNFDTMIAAVNVRIDSK